MKKNQIERKTHIIDAKGKPLGRLASQIAILLRGKHKPQYQPHLDIGDFVIVKNVEKIKKLLENIGLRYRTKRDSIIVNSKILYDVFRELFYDGNGKTDVYRLPLH